MKSGKALHPRIAKAIADSRAVIVQLRKALAYREVKDSAKQK